MNFDFLKNLLSGWFPEHNKIQPVPHQQKKLESIKPVKKPYQPDDIYIPEIRKTESAFVKEIDLTSQEAVRAGFSFHKKSKSVRITNYHGQESTVIIPAYIDDKKVNEIGTKAFFLNQTVRKLRIPSTVRKIGESAFGACKLETCVFADGLQKLPKHAFSGSRFLKKVVLPNTLQKIGDSAFMGCRNLKYIHFPASCYQIRNQAFSYSGLEGFSIEISHQRVSNGEAFRFTPLEKNHTLIIGNHIDMPQPSGTNYTGRYVLLVGQKAKEFTIPESSWLMFGKNSFNNSHDWFSVSFHQSESLITFFRSFDAITHPINLYFYLLAENCRFEKPLPYFVHAYQGRKLLPCHLKWERTEPESVITLPVGNRLTWQEISYMSCITTIQSERKGILYRIEENAFHDRRLAVCVLDLTFYATDQKIFSDNCYNIYKVILYEDDYEIIKYSELLKRAEGRNEEIIKYIPCADLIGAYAHSSLLQAFRQNPDKQHFFDSQVILDAMIKNTSGVHTRQRIFIAVDALRSKKRKIDVNTDFFLHYLEKHKEQAEQVLTQVSEDYPEYLEFFRSLPFIN